MAQPHRLCRHALLLKIMRYENGENSEPDFTEPVTLPHHPRPMGLKIHQLTPTMSLQERFDRFIETLNPKHPDPPAQDDPYEYPYTEPFGDCPRGRFYGEGELKGRESY